MSRSPGERALVLAPRMPHPPRSGGDLRTWHTVRALRERRRVTVLGLDVPLPPPPGFPPEDWQSHPIAGEMAAADEGLLEWVRRPGGHPTDRWLTPGATEAIRAAAGAPAPDVAVVEGLFLHRYLPTLRELGCPVVLDAHNLEGPLHDELTDGRTDVVSRLYAERLGAIERRVFAAVDAVWVCSADDAARAAERYPDSAPVHVVPNTVDVAAYAGGDGRASVPTVLFLALLAYPPNDRAARRLVADVWPAVRRARPDARLVLAGAEPSAALREAVAAGPGGIELTGEVAEVLPYLRAAWTMVVPLREGGGTRLKVLEAFAASLPVVSTAKGVEGLGLRAGEHYVAAESAPETAAAILALLDDERRREELARAGRELVAREYDVAVAAARVGEALAVAAPAG